MASSNKLSTRRSRPSYFMAIFGVTLVLIIIGILGWMVMNAGKLGQYFKENIEVRVYLRENITPKDSAALATYIKVQPYVKEYQYITKELAKKKFLSDGNSDWSTVLDANPLPASIDFKLKSQYVTNGFLAIIKKNLERSALVSDVQYPQSLVNQLNNNVKKIGLVLLSIAILLCVIVIFLIDNTIRLAMFSNRFLIKTMQMVGATRWFIAKPMDIRAIINGSIAGVVAIVCILGLIIIAENQLPELRALQDTSSLILLCLGLLLLGVCISLFSTHRSILKYLKRKLDDLY